MRQEPEPEARLKLHLANSRIDYHNAAHIEQLRRVFRAANGHGIAVVAHLRPGDDTRAYGRDEARIFLEQVLPEAPDVPVQLAHLAGETGSEESVGDQTLMVFVEAVEKGDPRTRQLWFDVTLVATARTSPERAALIAKRIRQLGVQRVLFGSDAATPGSLPRDNWQTFRALPLTDAEFQTISNNVPPYMR